MDPSTRYLLPVLDAAAMRRADAHAIDTLGIGGFTLMETAGRAVADAVQELASGDRPEVVILCGKGNNGGDGFVAARTLADRGFPVRVATTVPRQDYEGDAARHLEVLLKLMDSSDAAEFGGASGIELSASSIVVDALLGTGLSSDVREPVASVIERLGEANPRGVVSVDIPSGIDSDTGRVLGLAVRADVTVTMAAFKSGLLLGEGPDYAGRVVVADIGIPRAVISEQAAGEGGARLSCDRYVCDRLPPRSRSDHKYSTGPTLVVGGSSEFPGAPVLAARAAARTGSGYVVACGPESIRTHLSEKLTEIPVGSWPEDAPPKQAVERLAESLGTRWDKARSLLIGPGLGRTEFAADFVRELLEAFPGPAVVDADALHALRDDRDWVAERSDGRWIFTPHLGEFQRLVSAEEGIHDRVGAVRRMVTDWHVTLLLKGMPSMSAAPGSAPIICGTGNPAAGTAGSGDVLAGIVAGLSAQGLNPLDAAACGIHLAGYVADRFVRTRDARSMMAGDVVEMLPDALSDLCGGS